MKIYLFVLGRDPELAIAEIKAYLEAKNIEFLVMSSNYKIAAIKTELNNPEAVINELGGTVKIAEVISTTNLLDDVERNLENSELYRGTGNKAEYCITANDTRLESFVRDYLKDYFKRIRVKAVYKKDAEPTRLLRKNFKDKMIDIVIYKNMIGRTLAVTDVLETKYRDVKRPSVDYMKVISIRLAKILINLSKVKENGLLVDPFCGSATILQEALLRNINVVGIDVDNESIKQSRENLEWLRKNYKIKSEYRLYNLDSRNITKVTKDIDAVVTEPYLGPYVRKLPNISQARELVMELRGLYYNFIKEAFKVLKPDGRIVMVIPRIRTMENRQVVIDFENLAKEAGFELAYKPILYGYKNNKIGREIYVLEKIKKYSE